MRAAPDIADAHERQGFACPLAALPAAEAAAYRRELEAIARVTGRDRGSGGAGFIGRQP